LKFEDSLVLDPDVISLCKHDDVARWVSIFGWCGELTV